MPGVPAAQSGSSVALASEDAALTLSGRGARGEGGTWDILPGTCLSCRQEAKTQHWPGSC